MASSNKIIPFFFIALLFATTTPSAHGIVLGTTNGLMVNGNLCCTPTGNCPGGPGLAGTTVSLNCASILGISTIVGRNTTNVDGFFSITVPRTRDLILGLPVIPCVVTVDLPLDSAICPALAATNGVLVSALRNVGTTVSSTLGRVPTAQPVVFELNINA